MQIRWTHLVCASVSAFLHACGGVTLVPGAAEIEVMDNRYPAGSTALGQVEARVGQRAGATVGSPEH